MEYTVTVDLFHVLWISVLAIAFYLYTKDNGDDKLTQIRHDVEMKKEWFRMLAEQGKQKTHNNRRV